MLSFNSPLGMCPGCKGRKVDLGWEHEHGEGWKLEGEPCERATGCACVPSRARCSWPASHHDATR